MRLGAFTVADAHPGSIDRLGQVVRLAESVEASGLASFWVAEHHFHDGGVCPSPPVVLAACAARTRRIRLGALVSVLPFHRPVDLAEEYAVVDQLSGGRLNLGVGSGYLASEFEGFGIDPAEKRSRFDATLGTVLDAFAGRPIRVGGETSPGVRLNVRPVQRPHPAIWVAVQRREAVVHVAGRGLSIALIPYATVDRPEELGAEIAEYRRALPVGVRGDVVVAVHLYGGRHIDLARAAFRTYVTSRLATGSTFLQRKSAERPEHASPEAIERAGLALFGTPEEVARRARAFADLGVDELLGIFDFGGLPEAEVAASVRSVGAAWMEQEGETRASAQAGPGETEPT